MAGKSLQRVATVPLPDSEKITVNLGFVDLGQVDLLVSEGFYSNRSDFIRTAIRQQIGQHQDVLRQAVSRRTLVLGLQRFTREDLETLRKKGEMINIRVLGMASIALDVTPQLALATIESIVVLGALNASREVKEALAGRTK
jgi:Arc/MetJ-type ribon-helix-helix transcriptional regulator